MIHRIGVKVVIIDKDKMLVTKRFYDKGTYIGYWNFPGGKVESKDKTLLDALMREVGEEIGSQIKVKINKIIGIYNYKSAKNKNTIYIGFLAKYISGGIIKGKEVEKFRWLMPKQIKELKITPMTRFILDSYLNNEVRYEL